MAMRLLSFLLLAQAKVSDGAAGKGVKGFSVDQDNDEDYDNDDDDDDRCVHNCRCNSACINRTI